MIRRFRGTGARRLIVLSFDAGITAFSFWLAMMLRFEGSVTEPHRTLMPTFLMLLVGYRVVSSYLFRLDRWSFRFSGLADGARVAIAGAFGTLLLLGTIYLLRHPGPPRSVVVLELLLSCLLMASLRFSPRLTGMYVQDWMRSRRDESVRVLIVGAGATGEMLLRDLQRSHHHSYQVVGFLDDDPTKQEVVVGGKSVLGRVEDLPEVVRRYQVEEVLLAIPLLQGRRIQEVLSLCADLKLRFKILPVSYVYLNRRAAASMMQELSPEDLLPRDPVVLSEEGNLPIEGRTALVTGAAGTIGSEICLQLLRGGLRELIMVDINENGLYLLKKRCDREFPHSKVEVEVADIRERGRIRSLFEQYRPQDVFHAAAHKHVPLMESAPCEAVKNNILGTRNLADTAHEFGADRFLLISTDKAVRPSSVMGATKRVAEKLVRSMARRSSTRFCAVRFGNVLGSAGSVVPIFREQIATGGPVCVTHPEVQRYFMTISEAVALVLRAGYSDYGELCILDMGEPIRILELARHMITMSGLVPDVDVPIVFTGLRPGEKLSEELMTEDEERTIRVTHKIFVADCPAPPPDLEARIDHLERAAYAEQSGEVVALLYQLVPSYGLLRSPLPREAGAVEESQPPIVPIHASAGNA